MMSSTRQSLLEVMEATGLYRPYLKRRKFRCHVDDTASHRTHMPTARLNNLVNDITLPVGGWDISRRSERRSF